MKSRIRIKDISELPFMHGEADDMRKRITCVMFDHINMLTHFSSPVHMDAFVAILVLSGSAKVSVNYKTFSVLPDSLLLLSSSHLFHIQECSPDFKSMCLLVSKELSDEIDSTDMVFQRTKYSVRMYHTPVLLLETSRTEYLLDRITAIDKAISDKEHFYYKEMIQNTLFAFFLDVSDRIERYTAPDQEGNVTRYETIIQSFMELLAVHYREEHLVDFYASRLHISAHYLTQIVKSVTGQTVTDFIFEMLYSEARTLLAYSRLSIQEIAVRLNFSDQSSFGKFFKRKAGTSPVSYRREHFQRKSP